MERMVEEFEKYLEADGKSPKTVRSYVGDVREFLRTLGEEGRDGARSEWGQVTAFRARVEAGLKPRRSTACGATAPF